MINIYQSWTEIIVYLTTPMSMSRSSTAVIQMDDPEGAALIYQYQNQPLADAMRTMHMHYGTAMLRISNGGCLAGDYYAGRDRRTFGRICCKRVYRCLLELGPGWERSEERRVGKGGGGGVRGGGW